MRPRRAIITTIAIAIAAVLALALPASAHVTVNPSEAPRGGFAKLTFRVPNEHDTASTTSVEVNFPTDHVIASARTKPVPGWTAKIEKSATAVTKITWSGGKIAPGEFEEFDVSLRLPTEGDSVMFPSVQTYDNGDAVRWIEDTPAGGEEPEHPAPVLTLVAGTGGDDHHDAAPADGGDGEADGDEAATEAGDGAEDGDDSNALPAVAIAVSVLATVLSVIALTRRRP